MNVFDQRLTHYPLNATADDYADEITARHVKNPRLLSLAPERSQPNLYSVANGVAPETRPTSRSGLLARCSQILKTVSSSPAVLIAKSPTENAFPGAAFSTANTFFCVSTIASAAFLPASTPG